MYDNTKQYRCTIVRGKSKNEIDNLLPAYAKVINEICPCAKDDFPLLFNKNFEIFLEKKEISNEVNKKKTLDNHRTEIAGKLSECIILILMVTITNQIEQRNF